MRLDLLVHLPRVKGSRINFHWGKTQRLPDPNSVSLIQPVVTYL